MSNRKSCKSVRKVYNCKEAFSIPASTVRKLDLHSGMKLYLEIAAMNGKPRFSGIVLMRSGPEIYGQGLKSILRRGRNIRIKVSRVRQ